MKMIDNLRLKQADIDKKQQNQLTVMPTDLQYKDDLRKQRRLLLAILNAKSEEERQLLIKERLEDIAKTLED